MKQGTHKRTVKAVPKTEGQRLLIARPEGAKELAELVGLPIDSIDHWQYGRRKPSGPNARKLAELLGIPVASWTQTPTLVPDPSPPANPAPSGPRKPVRTLAEVDALLEQFRAEEGSLDARERKRRMSERIALLRLRAQIERGDANQADAVVRTSELWRKIREALREALKKHPDALSDVVAALSAVSAWDDAAAELDAVGGNEEAAR